MSGLVSSSQRLEAALSHLVGARQADADHATAAVYLRALADLDVSLVERACDELGKEVPEKYKPLLPAVGVIRERVELLARRDAEAAARAALRALPAAQRDDDEPRYYCWECRDETNNWKLVWCPGAGRLHVVNKPDRAKELSAQRCHRHTDHPPHIQAVKCSCAPHNRVAYERRERERVRRAEQERKAS